MSTGENISASAQALSFFERYQPQFERLTGLLQMEVQVDDLEAMVAATQPWVKGDHARPEHKINPSEQLSQELHVVFGELGLLDSHDLPSDTYNETLVLGAIHRGNGHRLSFLKEMVEIKNVNPGKVSLFGGERFVYPEQELEDISRTVERIIRQTPDDPWLKQLRNGDAAIVWETDLLRLEGLAQLNMQPVVPDVVMGHNPNRPHIRSFMWGTHPVELMHTAKVIRPNGSERHTTEACIADWVITAEPAENINVAMIAACPHIERMGMSARRILRMLDRADINLEIGGPAAKSNLNPSRCLGEIGRSLYEVKLALEGEVLPG
jgi:hypothetical protein